MGYSFIIISTCSILIPGIIGLIRFQKINPVFYFFIFFIWIGIINEGLSYILIHSGKSNAITGNMYLLTESILILFLFKSWRLFQRSWRIFYLVFILFTGVWFLESFVLSTIKTFNSYFIIVHSFIVVLMSISTINILIANERKNLLKNANFIICLAFVFYFTNAVIIEIFTLYGISFSNKFQVLVWRVLTFVNLITNLIYAYAILWMPKKLTYTQPY